MPRHLLADVVILIRRYGSAGYSTREIADGLGLARSTVHNVRVGKTHKHVTDIGLPLLRKVQRNRELSLPDGRVVAEVEKSKQMRQDAAQILKELGAGGPP